MEMVLVITIVALFAALITCCVQSDELEDVMTDNGKILRDWDRETRKLEKEIKKLKRQLRHMKVERDSLVKYIEELNHECKK